jgi:hypothetical protein
MLGWVKGRIAPGIMALSANIRQSSPASVFENQALFRRR